MFRALTRERTPLWLYPGLLSLDAPLVAVAWLHVFANIWRVNYLPWMAYLALGLAVWVIHVANRLQTARRFGGEGPGARHRFHARHAPVFLGAGLLAVLALLVLVLTQLPVSVFGYLPVGVVLVAGFLVISRLHGGLADDSGFGRTILAGAALAYGTAMMAHLFLPGMGKHDLVRSREFLTFAVLCVLYLRATDFWEKSAARAGTGGADDVPGDLAITLPVLLLGVAALVFAITSHHHSVRPFYYAILTGAALIHVINRNCREFSSGQLRLLADGAMLAPAVIFHAYPAA